MCTCYEIIQAYQRIDPVFLNSPQFYSEPLSRLLAAEIYIKNECCNPIGSFKGRGAEYLLSQLAAPGELVCASAGNFGQGLAYAARKRQRALTVFAAESVNTFKLERMSSLGARVILKGRDFDEAKSAAKNYAESHEAAIFIEDGADARISIGAGTIGLELSLLPRLDAILLPLGNGALLHGVASWCKSRMPNTAVIGVCAEGAAAMRDSLLQRRCVSTTVVRTIADGIAVRNPVPFAVEALSALVDDVVLVNDQDLLKSMELVLRELGQVVEPAAVAGLAAVAAHPQRFRGQRIATVLCGSNIAKSALEQLQSERKYHGSAASASPR